MNYISTLNRTQIVNIGLLLKAMDKWGITNQYSRAAILAVVSKESNLLCKREKGYSHTNNSQIRKVFGKRVSMLTESQLDGIKASDEDFFNLVYKDMYGNGHNEGFRFRGGGFNQLTFKNNYSVAAKMTGRDLVNHPEQIKNPEVAAEVSITYFIRRFQIGFSAAHQAHYNSKGINGFSNINDAVLAFYHCNAGFGKSMYSIDHLNEATGGLLRAVDRAPEFLSYLSFPIVTNEQGNHFRAWVNDNYPVYAKRIDLDRSGAFDNSYIRKAWTSLGAEYLNRNE